MRCLLEDSHATSTEVRRADSADNHDEKRGEEVVIVPEVASDLYIEWKYRLWEQIAQYAATH